MAGVSAIETRTKRHQASAGALREQLSAWSGDEGLWIYVLLDPNHPVAAHDPLHASRLAGREGISEPVPVRRPDFSSSPELWPRLLALRSPHQRGWLDEALLDLTLANALARRASINGVHACGWLVARHAPADLAQRLSRSLSWRAPSMRQHVLPWFEPHRWSLLGSSAEICERLRALMPGLVSWHWIDLAGYLGETRWDGGAAALEHDIPPMLDALRWGEQRRMTQARQVVLALAKSGADFPAGAERAIDRALQQADTLGLQQLEDRLCFALHSINLASHWYRQPEAIDCLEQARLGRASLADALDALPDDVLAHLAHADQGSDAQSRKGIFQ